MFQTMSWTTRSTQSRPCHQRSEFWDVLELQKDGHLAAASRFLYQTLTRTQM